MKRTTYFVFLVNLLVQGDFNSNFMFRNPSYDNRGTNAVHIISSSNSNSCLACTSQCTAWGECKSVMFNIDTHECQLLSVHMDDQSDAGPHSSVGWLYYEKEFDCTIWHLRFGHWYLLDSKYRTFNDSRTFCASLSLPAYVIEVQSETENDWLIELTSNRCGVPHEYWLNGYDTDNSGTFTWIDSQTPSTYTNWYTGEPNDNNGGINSEKCIASSTGYEGVWVDIPCTFSRPVVCERNL